MQNILLKIILLFTCHVGACTACIMCFGDPAKFYLYNEKSSSGKELPLNGECSSNNCGIDRTKETVFLIHGFKQTQFHCFPRDVKNAYLKEGSEINVINVDWSCLSCSGMGIAAVILYPLAVESVEKVGQAVASFIQVYAQKNLIDLHRVTVVGFSLGAHVAGAAGNAFYKDSGGKIPMIVGLDPAGPLFSCESNKKHDPSQVHTRSLSKWDAEFVYVIHTDMGIFGTDCRLGHRDDYPNCGIAPQPKCGTFFDRDLKEMTSSIIGCSHLTAPYLWAASIGNSSMIALPCESCEDFKNGRCSGTPAVFGKNLVPGITGEFYLETEPIVFNATFDCGE